MARQPNGGGSVYRRASTGRWVCALSLPRPTGGTRRVTATFATRKEAEAHRHKVLADTAAGAVVITGRTTVRAFLTRWLAYKAERVRPTTHVWYTMHCTRYLLPLLGPTQLREVTPLQVQAVLDHWAATDLSPTTIGHIRDTLRAASAVFSALVPRKQCAGLTQRGLSPPGQL